MSIDRMTSESQLSRPFHSESLFFNQHCSIITVVQVLEKNFLSDIFFCRFHEIYLGFQHKLGRNINWREQLY